MQELEQTIKKIVEEVILPQEELNSDKEINIDEDIKVLGLNSLDSQLILMAIENELEISFQNDYSSLYKETSKKKTYSINNLIEYVKEYISVQKTV